MEIDEEGYSLLEQGSQVMVKNIHAALAKKSPIEVTDGKTHRNINCTLNLSERESEILREGGLLNFIYKKVRG
jgi:aconitase A